MNPSGSARLDGKNYEGITIIFEMLLLFMEVPVPPARRSPLSEESPFLQAGVARLCNNDVVEHPDAENLSCFGKRAGDGDVSI